MNFLFARLLNVLFRHATETSPKKRKLQISMILYNFEWFNKRGNQLIQGKVVCLIIFLLIILLLKTTRWKIFSFDKITSALFPGKGLKYFQPLARLVCKVKGATSDVCGVTFLPFKETEEVPFVWRHWCLLKWRTENWT